MPATSPPFEKGWAGGICSANSGWSNADAVLNPHFPVPELRLGTRTGKQALPPPVKLGLGWTRSQRGRWEPHSVAAFSSPAAHSAGVEWFLTSPRCIRT